MPARKGIKEKVVQWLKDHPDEQFTGRFLEDLYILHGGAVFPMTHERRGLRGRVSQDTMRAFISKLPLRKVSSSVGGSVYKEQFDRAKFEYSPPP